MGAGPTAPAGTAGQHPAVVFPTGMDRAERRGGEGREYARMGRDSLGDSLTAGQARADELVGVGPVDLGAGQAPGGPAGLAGDG